MLIFYFLCKLLANCRFWSSYKASHLGKFGHCTRNCDDCCYSSQFLCHFLLIDVFGVDLHPGTKITIS